MNQLHALFTLRNQRAFQRLLDGSADRGQLSSTPASSSGGRSWNRPSAPMSPACDVNARDWLGRTVLHLACATTDSSAIEYVKLLLAHPTVNVNLCDLESNWTALHRALYAGNIPTALLLLQRSDTDVAVKDFEGYTAFDLYNSTVEGTKPSPANIGRVELFTWGSNKNASLGLDDADDRASPESVVIGSGEHSASQARSNIKLFPVDIREVAMSKFHTAVVTLEQRRNLHVCGIGSTGRLGPIQHTQYGLQRIPGFTHTILTVALGQDHTLALTASGEVLSWGSNRFSQLGYIVEPGPDNATGVGRAEEPIQSSPRKIHGPLKKEFVCGVAASKISSACWTSREVFTWGTNNGQLGHDMHANPVQILPRRVSKITAEVISISMSDHAMACLSRNEVFCIWNDKVVKLNFPSRFPNDIQVNWSPHAPRHNVIKKITTCDDVFAALSFDGELFIFTIPKVSENVGIKPQRVWALRKKFTSVTDVALGADGTIIVCTESGHVFHRCRSTKPGSVKTSKFQRISGLQRVTNVCANSAGAFGALRSDFRPRPIHHTGNTFVQDIGALQPYLHSPRALVFLQPPPGTASIDICSCDVSVVTVDSRNTEDEDEDDVDIQQDVKTIEKLCHILICNKHLQRGASASGQISSEHGADVILETSQGHVFPVHRVILAARCPTLEKLLSGVKEIQDRDTQLSLGLIPVKSPSPKPALLRLLVKGCHALSLLLLTSYLYTNDLPAIWDPRVAPVFKGVLQNLKTTPKQIQLDLQALARVLDITSLLPAVGSPTRVISSSSMTQDIGVLLHRTLDHHSGFNVISPKSPIFPDVTLQLADTELSCHSTILRSRCAFFADFFDDPDWTVNRWDENGIIKVDMKHLPDQVIRFILQYIYGDDTIFANDGLMDFDSIDEYLEFAFEVMSAANELLLDRLMLLCSAKILGHVNIKNACYILAEATHYNATLLVDRVSDYIAANMETFLESGTLQDIPDHLIGSLAACIQRKQNEKSPVQRSQQLIESAMKRQSEWLNLQDIPQPIAHTTTGLHKHSPKLSPSKRLHRRPSNIESIPNSPLMPAHSSSRGLPPAEDDIFVLDGLDPTPAVHVSALSPAEASTAHRQKAAWKTGSPIPRVDLKSLMAEAESNKKLKLPNTLSVPVQHNGALPSDAMPGAQASSGERAQRSAEKGRMASSSGNQSANLAVTALGQTGPTELPWRKTLIHSPISLTGPATQLPVLGTAQVGPSQSTQAKEHRPGIPTYGADSHSQSGNIKQSHHTQRSLGPIISPSRQPTGSTSSSRRASGKAWTLPPVQPTTQSSSVGPGVSLVAIQEMQLGQGAVTSHDKRSFVEIQEEEQAHRTEADFLRWWSAEEQRVKAEEEELLSQILKQTTPPKRHRKLKKK